MGMVDFSLGDIGGVFTSIREAITGEKIKDPQKLLEEINKLETTMIDAKSKVVEAEAKSEHWLVASWRPITMLTFVVIVANNYIVVPYAGAFGYPVPTLDIPPDMWDLLQIGLGGYVVGRSAEKVAKEWKK